MAAQHSRLGALVTALVTEAYGGPSLAWHYCTHGPGDRWKAVGALKSRIHTLTEIAPPTGVIPAHLRTTRNGLHQDAVWPAHRIEEAVWETTVGGIPIRRRRRGLRASTVRERRRARCLCGIFGVSSRGVKWFLEASAPAESKRILGSQTSRSGTVRVEGKDVGTNHPRA